MGKVCLMIVAVFGSWFLVSGSPAWSAATRTVNPPSDLKINTEIEAVFDRDDHIDLRDVHVKTDRGITTLSGTVLTDYEKAYAEQLVGDVRDRLGRERGVVNEITVIIPADADLALAKDIRSDLLQNPAVHVSKLKVSVQNGSVHLQGFVPSQDQKKRVDKIVKDGRQVASVKDDLVILARK